jgi:hypothetical protein
MADIQPYPPRGTAKAIRQVQRQLCCFEYLAPQFRNLHPLEATSPQECSEIAAHAFRSLRFDTTYRIPSYRRWLERTLPQRHTPLSLGAKLKRTVLLRELDGERVR